MLIDVHAHAFAPKIAARAIEQLTVTCETLPLTDGTVEATPRRMDEWGVDRAVLLPTRRLKSLCASASRTANST